MKKYVQLEFDFKSWEDEEIWKDVRKGYQASNKGRTRSLDRYVERNGKLMFVKGRILKPRLNRYGYPIISVCINGKAKNETVHKLVWEAFNGKVPEGYEINHIDENPQNSSLSNLNLLTHKANICWGTCPKRIGEANRLVQRNNKKKSKSVIQKNLQGEVIKIWPSVNEIERQLGYNHGYISWCCIGKFAKAYGYLWEYEKATA